MKKLILVLALVLVFIYGCDQVVCNTPYIQVGSECCLDTDDNKICDMDEEVDEDSKIDISDPKVVEKEVKKYVCTDGSIADDPADCEAEDVYTEEPVVDEGIDEESQYVGAIEIPELNTSSKNDNLHENVILNVSLQPTCTKGVNGGSLYYEIDNAAVTTVQVKEVGKEYEDVLTIPLSYGRRYKYFGICNDCYAGEFRIKPDTAYILRLKFDQTPVYGRYEYSNEYLIDTRADSDYMSKICSG
jgi:hypothetical protein